MENFNEILDELTAQIAVIPKNKKYWLIRTQSGSLYENFIENNFVGINRDELTVRELADLRSSFTEDNKFQEEVKKAVRLSYKNEEKEDKEEISAQKIGLNSSQIFNFYTNVKAGDIVIIPSADSRHISFGIIQESFIAEFTEEEKRKFEDVEVPCLNKRVSWIKEFRRHSLDPNIFRMFTAHHAINNVSSYAEIIERTLQDLYILDDIAHLVINVQQTQEIKAKDLFGMGYSLLELVDMIAKDLNLEGISSDDLEVTVNLNSPGKIDLKSSIKKTTVFAGLILLVCGGGYNSRNGASLKTEGIKQFIEAIADYQDRVEEREARKDDRELKKAMFKKYEDSLNVKTPEDMINLMKQVDTNKDTPK